MSASDFWQQAATRGFNRASVHSLPVALIEGSPGLALLLFN